MLADGAPDPLARLTDAERAALRLLGQGHDTKSAAAALGISAHAVGERLREARRKLGVTSSREAARRLLAAESGLQEIRAGFSGDAAAPGAGHAAPRRVNRRAVLAGVAVMSAIAFAALAWSLASPAAQPPRVLATAPAEGAAVPAGPFTLSVTFDQPMQANSFSFVQTDPATFPQCARVPVQSADRRTFTLQCRAQPGRQYEVWFNRARWQNFKGLGGQPAVPYRLTFRTAP